MPLFEYQCTACKHAFEALLRSTTAPAPACPACGARQVRKTLSVFNAAATSSATPCASGGCPSANPRTGCGGGGCPFK